MKDKPSGLGLQAPAAPFVDIRTQARALESRAPCGLTRGRRTVPGISQRSFMRSARQSSPADHARTRTGVDHSPGPRPGWREITASELQEASELDSRGRRGLDCTVLPKVVSALVLGGRRSHRIVGTRGALPRGVVPHSVVWNGGRSSPAHATKPIISSTSLELRRRPKQSRPWPTGAR